MCVFHKTYWVFSRSQELLSALYISDPSSRACDGLQAGDTRTINVPVDHMAFYDALMSSTV